EAVSALQPITAFLLDWWAGVLDVPDPFVECAPGLLVQLGDPPLHHRDARMDGVNRAIGGRNRRSLVARSLSWRTFQSDGADARGRRPGRSFVLGHGNEN